MTIAPRVGPGSGNAVSPAMQQAIDEMKSRALRIRSRRNWLTLGFIVLFQLPAGWLIVNEALPGIDPKYILGGAIFPAVILAHLVHGWQMRNLHPRCPKCKGEWVVNESETGNKEHFSALGSCPHCGIPI